MAFEFKLPDIGEGVVEGEIVSSGSSRPGRGGQGGPADRRGDDRQGDGGDPVAARGASSSSSGRSATSRRSTRRSSSSSSRRAAPRGRRAARRRHRPARPEPSSRRARPASGRRRGPPAPRPATASRDARGAARSRASWGSTSTPAPARRAGRPRPRPARTTSPACAARRTATGDAGPADVDAADLAAPVRPRRAAGGRPVARPRSRRSRTSARSAGHAQADRREHGALEADRRALHVRRGVRRDRARRAREGAEGRRRRRGVKLTFLPFIVKAVVAALKKHPKLNATLDEATKGDRPAPPLPHRRRRSDRHGLVVPVVRDADRRSIVDLAARSSGSPTTHAGRQGDPRGPRRLDVHDHELVASSAACSRRRSSTTPRSASSASHRARAGCGRHVPAVAPGGGARRLARHAGRALRPGIHPQALPEARSARR